MTKTEVIWFAENSGTKEMTWNTNFTFFRKGQHNKFIAALNRVMNANTPSVTWKVTPHQYMLNVAYDVKVTAPAHQIALIVKYFIACGF